MIKIYTLPDCEHCKDAKEYFNKKNEIFEEINMKKGGNKSTIEMKKKFKEQGIDTAPIIVIGDNIIPGFDIDIINSIMKW